MNDYSFPSRLIFFLFLLNVADIQSASLDVIKEFKVSRSNLNVFSTPIAVTNEGLYVVSVLDPEGVETGMNLITVLDKGKKNDNDNWIWKREIIDSRTINDPYHTQPSVAVDKAGFIHVAYNMHNMPWQYKKSVKPYDIKEMLFVGDDINEIDLFKVKALNKTGFSERGNSFIKGTQVTYPAFFYDRNGDVYITYRFAYEPEKKWKDRELSVLMAKYNLDKNRWNMLGGLVNTGKYNIFAKDARYVPYVPRMFFDKNNRMHVSLMWRLGGPGADANYPSYLYSDDAGKSFYDIEGNKLNVPISVHTGNINIDSTEQKYYAITDIAADNLGNPYILMHLYKGKYILKKYDKNQNKWKSMESFPSGASSITYWNGALYAFASGPVVYIKDTVSEKWTILDRGKGKRYCNPKVSKGPYTGQLYLYSQSCDLRSARVYKLNIP